MKIGSEFVAGVLVGIALGWGLDSAAGTSPWGLIVFMMLGFAAGVVNVIRSSSSMSTSAEGAEKDQ
ncbi:MAG TPA: AtpZ/AtpI family protein [Afifellaceae bacterium]|nr:AtpZ/AtpI family protein [Afifellaceae bacterium]